MNTSGTVVERYDYDPYGQVSYLNANWGSISSSAYALNYLFQGLRLDTAVNLYDQRYRVDSPALGRPIQADPLGLGAGDSNVYRSEGNNPANVTDPLGLFPPDMWGGLQDQTKPGPGENYAGTCLENIPKIPQQGPDLVQQIDQQLQQRQRMAAQGMTPPPLTAGDVPIYGMDGNSTAGAAMVQAGKAIAYMTGAAGVSIITAPLLGPLDGVVFSAFIGAAAGYQAQGNSEKAIEMLIQGGLTALFSPAGTRMLGRALGNVANGVGKVLCDKLRILCFAEGTHLLVPGGSKPIEQFKPGDWILSAPDDDPEAPPEPKQVEEVFTNHLSVLNLHVCGQIIQTTPGHPFYVKGLGWTAAAALEVGDLLRSYDGRWIPVEDMCDSGEELPVYNLRVADHHTYFVGRRDWGFSVWAHNLDCDGLLGQLHHVISKKIWRALDKHAILKGLFKVRDPRFVTRAISAIAHKGYQKWHRDLDRRIVEWLERFVAASEEEFMQFLKTLYNDPDLLWRFPKGF
ncbi:MAG: polymorphic toxin-type HINT domain-containing protein [Gemmataceae bacterium]